jgi:hypothetical protein
MEHVIKEIKMTETLSLLELREKWSQAWGKQAKNA